MLEKNNLQELRDLLPPSSGFANGQTVHVINHSTIGDNGGGIFMWRNGPAFQNGLYSEDNDGTIIKSENVAPTEGSWVRQYDGFINVLFFGAFGYGNDYTYQIQRAIDFAATNAQLNPQVKGSTVYIPNGSYVLSNILLKSGIDIIGESLANTNIYTDVGREGDYLFTIGNGPVNINISNLHIEGRDPKTDEITLKGCFHFEAKPDLLDPVPHGGLWNSTFKNIIIRKFLGNGIHLQAGEGSFSLLPNQFNIFENFRVFKHNDKEFSKFSNALKMTGQNGQHTFINCQFDGYVVRENNIPVSFDRWRNVVIENNFVETNGLVTSNVVTFLNCTFQDSDYGILINYAENITIDNCWFENLGVAITIEGNDKFLSKSINILNSRFTNASGFGSLKAPDNIKDGQCVSVNHSVANIYNNYITASRPDQVDPRSLFVLGFPGNPGINLYGNTFRWNSINLRRTFGVMQVIGVATDTIDCKSNRLVSVVTSENVISNIVSSINAGELLTVRAYEGPLHFNNKGNINLTGRATFSLDANDEVATFIKIDIGPDSDTYQLVSYLKSTP